MPKYGDAKESVSISISSKFLEIIDRAAGHLDMTRSDFITKATQSYILQNQVRLSGKGAELFWCEFYKNFLRKS